MEWSVQAVFSLITLRWLIRGTASGSEVEATARRCSRPVSAAQLYSTQKTAFPRRPFGHHVLLILRNPFNRMLLLNRDGDQRF